MKTENLIKWIIINWRVCIEIGMLAFILGFLIGVLADLKIKEFKEDFKKGVKK